MKSQTKQVVHRNQRKEVLHLFRWDTHTPTHTHTPGRNWVNPERQEGKKTDTNDGPTDKTAQGGKGTTEPQEPTYTEKRTQPAQSTHLNPTTHYRGARGKLGTERGTR